MHSIVGSRSSVVEQPDKVVLQGYHKKLKTMKKKYFVLCGETPSRAARLEYYDSEKKFKSRSNPKKTIILKNCFNINRRLDTKYKHVIALSVRDGGFCIVLDTEEELNKWLKALLTLQRGEDTESEMPKPTFEHVWQVLVQRKGLAEEKGLLGSYHVCLTSKSLTLYRIGSPRTNQGESRLYSVEFELTTIRRCGDSQCYFYMEVGRHSAIGAGELWMETEDTLIAQNMHTMIINAMSSTKFKDDSLDPMRKRSSSETSKPTSGIQRRQTTTGIKPVNSSPQTNSTLGRDRCDSLPSRNRTISECSNQSITNSSMPPPKTIPINRPHSMYTNRHSHSPPVSAISPSTGCSESEGSSLSIDEPDSFDHSSLTPDESGNFVHFLNTLSSRGTTIPEEKDEIWYPDNQITSSDTEIPFIDKLNNHGGLSLPLSANQLARKGSPAMNSHTGSIDMQSQYMDMYSPYSPCGSSPCDQIVSGYIPISPSVECNRGLYTGSSGGHSRASSLAEETVDGYVPMCPPNQPTQEYVDMEQSIKQNNPSGFSSAASSSSIISGTPSTDLKFAEYPLEKVTSRFTPDDEDMQSISDRPTRAYSVGSRVEHNKRKLRIEFNNELQTNSRVRAFSVGSRAKVPRCELSRGVLQNTLFNNHMNATNSNQNNNIESTFNSAKQRNSKSSSAPLLLHKNHSSVERMSDLMEIDFSKNSVDSSSSSGSRRNLDMSSSFLTQSTQKASRISSIPVTVPFSGTTKSSSYSKATPPGYLEMRPGSFPDNNCFSSSSPLSLSKFETSGGGSNGSINNSNNGNCGYLEMKPVYMSKSPSLSSSPSKSMLSPKFSAKPPQQTQSYPISAKEYTSMNPSNNNKITNSQNDYMNISPASAEFTSNISTIKENERLMDIDQCPTTPDGYVPMNRNRNFSEGKSENPSNQFWINRSTSLPIDIKNANQPKHKYSVDLETSAIISGQNDIHSDSSLCNQNTMFSLSPCSPQKSFDTNQTANSNTMTNNNQNIIERKCLVDASNGTVTLLDNLQEKSKNVDNRPNNSISTLSSLKKLHISNTNSNSKSNFFKGDNPIKNEESFLCNYTDMFLNICEKQKNNSNDLKKDKNSSILTTEKNCEQREYVNFVPNSLSKLCEQKATTDNVNNISDNSNNCSNVSNSGSNASKADKSLFGCQSGSTKKFPIKDKSSIGVFEGFKPINDEMNNNNNINNSNNNNSNINNNNNNGNNNNNSNINNNNNNNSSNNNNYNNTNNNNNKINNNINFNNNNNNMLKKSPRATTLSSKNNQNSSCPTYELLRCDSSIQPNKFSLSRPSSVNSDKISPLKNTTISCQIRPNSANSECIPSPISNSSSTSTLCGGSSSTSSSSTLCGSKSQSPLASSRPQSFTDSATFDIMRADSNSSADTLSSTATAIAAGGINTLITSRPPSVVSEKELHYASLDLPPSTNPTTTSASSSSIPETKVNSSTSGDSSTSPSPNASCCQQQPAFAYAQIDFKKSSSGGSTDSGNNSCGISKTADQNSNNN